MFTNVLSAVVFVTVQAAATPAPPAKPQEKLICKRFGETGSLVKSRRECKTERDWQRERDAVRQRDGGVSSCRNAANGGPC